MKPSRPIPRVGLSATVRYLAVDVAAVVSEVTNDGHRVRVQTEEDETIEFMVQRPSVRRCGRDRSCCGTRLVGRLGHLGAYAGSTSCPATAAQARGRSRPLGSVIVGGSSVVVAAAGISRPRVVVSAGALTAFDDAELAASVDHEHGHIARRHRFAVVFGELCRAVGRLVPGARRAIEELEFHLESDADEYAIARLHDPLDLASAICKAAGTGASRGAVLSLYGSRKVTHRVRLLTQDHGRISSDFVNRCATAAAVGMTTLVLALVVSIPAATAAGMSRAAAPADVISCPR